MKRRDFIKTTGAACALFSMPVNLFAKSYKETSGIARACLMVDSVPQSSYPRYEWHNRWDTLVGTYRYDLEVNRDKMTIKAPLIKSEFSPGEFWIPSEEIAFRGTTKGDPFNKDSSMSNKDAESKRNTLEDRLFMTMLKQTPCKRIISLDVATDYAADIWVDNRSESNGLGCLPYKIIANPVMSGKMKSNDSRKVMFSNALGEREYIIVPASEYFGVMAETSGITFLWDQPDGGYGNPPEDDQKTRSGIYFQVSGMAILDTKDIVRVKI